GEVPNAFRKLGVSHFPGAIGAATGGAAALAGFIIPGTAADGMGVRLSGTVPGVDGDGLRGGFLVEIGIGWVEDPFGDVAVHIIKAPGIGLLLADLLIFEIAVLLVPGVIAQLLVVFAEEVGSGCAGAAGVFPFGFRGQAIKFTGLGAEPLAIFVRGMLRHAD